MSDLRPSKRSITLGGEQFNLLFSIGTIDEIQSGYNIALFTGINTLRAMTPSTYDVNNLFTLAAFLTSLLSTNGYPHSIADVIALLEKEDPMPIAVAVVALFIECAPEKDDEDYDDEDDGKTEDPEPSVNVARILCVAHEQLGYTEAEVWNMTMRKYNILLNQHLILTGRKKEIDIDTSQMFAG